MKIGNMTKKKKVRVLVVLTVAAIVIIIAITIAIRTLKKGGNENGGSSQSGMSNFAVLEGTVTASGVTSVGTTEVNFEVENLTTQLEIEEVYVSSEDEIEEGTKILKLTDESITEAREELEQTLKDTELAYRAGTIEYEQNKITAEYDRDSAILSGEEAEQVYNETISSLESSVQKAEDALDEANEQIAEYRTYVADGSYRSYFKVDEYEKLYNENLKLLNDKMAEWGIEWSQITHSGNTGSTNAGSSVGTGGIGNGTGSTGTPDAISTNTGSGTQDEGTGSGNSNDMNSLTNQYIKVLSSLYSVLEQNLKDKDQANSDYEDAVTNAQFELQTLELSLPSLQQAVYEAKENYDTQILQAKLTRETTLANAGRAESDYETAIEKAESDYETLKDNWEDAKANLELFESSVGDGFFYASGSGTILRSRVRAEQELQSGSTIFIYSNPEEMTVTVSVDQTDIAGIAVGDAAYVASTDGNSIEGVVTQINPVTSSTSRTSVTYNVTVKLSSDSSRLSSNQSVTVIFGASAQSGMEEQDENE